MKDRGLVVRKFGGTSMVKVDLVARIHQNEAQPGDVTVGSAFSGVTDLLINCGISAHLHRDYSGYLEQIKQIHQDVCDANGLEYSHIEERMSVLEASLKILSTATLPLRTNKTLKEAAEDYDSLEGIESEEEKAEVMKKIRESLEKHNLFYYRLSSAQIQAFGEKKSNRLLAADLRKLGLNSEEFDADYRILFTDSNYLNAKPLLGADIIVRESDIADFDGVAVVTGFIGQDVNGDTTLLGGRGGSDYSAAYFGAALDADEIEIWTDTVFMTADPELVENAKPVTRLSYQEAEELAYYGAKILHPACIKPAQEKAIPIRIRNTLTYDENPNDPGTLITESRDVKETIVKSLTLKPVYYTDFVSAEHGNDPGLAAYFFNLFGQQNIPVHFIGGVGPGVACSIDRDHIDYGVLDGILRDLEDHYGNDSVCSKPATQINMIGHGMGTGPPIVEAKTFKALVDANIPTIGTSRRSDHNLGVVVNEEDGLYALNKIHEAHFGD